MSDNRKGVSFLQYVSALANSPEAGVEIPGLDKSAEDYYFKKLTYLVVNTASERDFPKRVVNVVNASDNTLEPISDEQILSLKPLIEQNIGHELPQPKNHNKTSDTIRADNPKPVFSQGNRDRYEEPEEEPRRFGPQGHPNPPSAEPEMDYDEYAKNVRNDEYSKFSSSSRADLLKYSLSKSPFIHHTKVDNFISLFESDERNLMLNPDRLYRLMIKVFGREPGEIAFEHFKSLIKNFAKPELSFGNDPYSYGGQGGGGGQGGQNPQFQSYYHAVGILPAGLAINDPVARRLIEEYEEDKRAAKEEKRMKWKFNQMLDARMMDVMDPNKQALQGRNGGGGVMPDQSMQALVYQGIVTPIEQRMPDGSVITRYEPARSQNQQKDPMEMIRNTVDIVRGIMPQQQAQSGMMEPINQMFQASVQKVMNFDPIEQAMSMKKLVESMGPQNNQAFTIQAQDLALKEKRLELDTTYMARREDREHDRMKFEREIAEKAEQRSADQMKSTMKSFTELGTTLAPFLLPIIFKSGGGGSAPAAPNPLNAILGKLMGGGQEAGGGDESGVAGLGGLGDLLGGLGGGNIQDILKMIGGGGAGGGPQMQNQAPNVYQQDYDRVAAQQMRAQEAMQGRISQPGHNPAPHAYPYVQEEVRQPVYAEPAPVQEQVTVVQQPQETKKNYTPEDFSKYTVDQLQEFKAQGLASEASIDSFNSSLAVALNKKLVGTRRQVQVIPQQSTVSTHPVQTSQPATEYVSNETDVINDVVEVQQPIQNNSTNEAPQEESDNSDGAIG